MSRTAIRRLARVALASLIAVALAVASGTALAGAGASDEAAAKIDRPLRLISLNPSLSAIVVRLGGGDSLVGIDDYSARVLPSLADRPKVGGLFDPSLEAVVALRPDRVLIVAGVEQQSYGEQLEKLGVEVEVFQNERLDEVLENIERIGALLGREALAAERIRAILAMRSAVALAAKDLPHPATVAVVTRSPLFLVGADTFLDEMITAVGARNLGRDLAPGYPRGSIEWLIEVAPELLLDLTPSSDSASDFWARWPSLPAVAHGRVITVEASRVSMPGPDLDLALRELAVAVHGRDIAARIDAALRDPDAAAGTRGSPHRGDSIR
jgi:iron complex transport system substrate-binding protein